MPVTLTCGWLVVRIIEVGGDIRSLPPRGVDHPHAQTQETVDLAHPLGIAAGQVIVHRDDVYALRGQGVQVGGQGRHQRLAFAGAHLGDLAVVQDHAADELDIEMTHAQHPPAHLAHHGEGIGEQVFQGAARLQAPAQLAGLSL